MSVPPPAVAISSSRRAAASAALAVSYLLGQEASQPAPFGRLNFSHAPKSVIWLFMEGGPSHIDLYDPKPLLPKELNGKPMPKSFGRVITAMGTSSNTLLASKRNFKTARPERAVGFRLASAGCQTRRRHVRDSLLLGRRPESRRLGLPDEYRLDPRWPAVNGAGWINYGLRIGQRKPPGLRRSNRRG